MKKLSVSKLVFWIVLALAGIALGIIGSTTRLPDVYLWLAALVLWIIDGIWVGLHFLSSSGLKPHQTQPSFVGNQMAFERISKETEEATRRYLDAVNRKGMLKKSALYERPWFLLCGTEKSGKSSLLRGSGLNFPLRYPSEKDGLLVEGSDQIMWHFANEAVWIDTPGSFMNESGKDQWQSLVASLQRVRPVNPVDGVALAVNTNEILNTDDQGIKELARRLRSRIDDLIAQWGIEFPVYLLFNRTDEVPGFKDYFNEQSVRGQDQIFGATLGSKPTMPRLQFAEEFNLLCRSLTDIRLDKLFKERDEARKRMICRFVIHFEGIQQKLGALISELFKASSYEGKPIFRGFYFTSCYEKMADQDTPSASGSSGMSMTIVNHPLNPNRAFAAAQRPAASQGGKPRSEIRSLFVLPLFREIMVKDKTLVQNTQRRTRRELIRHYTVIGLLTAIAAAASVYTLSAKSKATRFLDEATRGLSNMPSDNAPLMEQYKGLDLLRESISRLQKIKDNGVPVSMGIGFYKGDDVLAKLKEQYFYRLKRFVVVPSVKYLEYDIRKGAESYGELAGDSYDNLYRSLKGYLSISEAASNHPQDIDTTFLRNVLLDAIKQSILATVKTSRLPVQVETILQENMGLFLAYLRRGEFPKIQENQRLVTQARQRLRRLPSARTLYEAVIGKLIPEAPRINLDQLLSRDGEGILKSANTISALYTQEGWDQSVSDAISEAAKNPFKLDWVIGLSKDDVPESMLDLKELRSSMVNAYLEDFKYQWLSFVGSVEMDPFGDLQRSSRLMQKLVGDRSELSVLLETVSNYTILKQDNEAEKAGSAALEAASKLKATKKLAKTVGTVSKKVSFSLGTTSPFESLNAVFDRLRSFSRSSGGALGGYEGYRDRILTLVEKLNAIEAQGEAHTIIVFNGKDSDPLLSGWKSTQSTLTSMPEELSAALRKVLLQPFEHTAAAASIVLTRSLNAKWQNEIVKPFTSRFSGRYPFASRGEDASFSDVMDFFRPLTGTYWGFYDRVLSAYVVKTESGWMVRTLGSLQLRFNPELSASLSGAERVRDIFFKQDGKLRSLDITLTPSGSNKNKAKLDVGGQVVELLPGGKSVRINWPLESRSGNALLKIMTGENFSQDLTFSGPWGFMKLLEAARVNPMNSSTVMAKWQVNVQNTYMVYLDTRVQVAGSDHPFGDPVFARFSCPTNLTVEQSPQETN